MFLFIKVGKSVSHLKNSYGRSIKAPKMSDDYDIAKEENTSTTDNYT